MKSEILLKPSLLSVEIGEKMHLQKDELLFGMFLDIIYVKYPTFRTNLQFPIFQFYNY